MPHRLLACQPALLAASLTLLGLCLSSDSGADDSPSSEPPSFEKIGVRYDASVQPLLEGYCLGCHSAEKAKGDLDLERMKSLSEVRRDPRVWQKVLFMLENGEMPPRKSKQLSDAQSELLRAWVRAYLNAEAHANAGDPGRVVVRRLSNAELDHTVRDLTGIDFRPTREFPADPQSYCYLERWRIDL